MRRLLPLLVSATLIAAACGSDSDSSADTTADTTPGTAATTAEAVTATTEAFAETTPDTSKAPVETVPESTEPMAPAVTAAELAATGPYAVGDPRVRHDLAEFIPDPDGVAVGHRARRGVGRRDLKRDDPFMQLKEA